MKKYKTYYPFIGMAIILIMYFSFKQYTSFTSENKSIEFDNSLQKKFWYDSNNNMGFYLKNDSIGVFDVEGDILLFKYKLNGKNMYINELETNDFLLSFILIDLYENKLIIMDNGNDTLVFDLKDIDSFPSLNF